MQSVRVGTRSRVKAEILLSYQPPDDLVQVAPPASCCLRTIFFPLARSKHEFILSVRRRWTSSYAIMEIRINIDMTSLSSCLSLRLSMNDSPSSLLLTVAHVVEKVLTLAHWRRWVPWYPRDIATKPNTVLGPSGVLKPKPVLVSSTHTKISTDLGRFFIFPLDILRFTSPILTDYTRKF